jgi:GTP-binding protein LepA
MKKVRNFCIIAHIDHGKSTLADRMLEVTGTIEKRNMKEQVLDRMDLERERGITIKLQPVTMHWMGYTLNLIDTPGHVDFTYEVSRSLAAVEGAILLVDATQGIQAQTLANLYLALEQNLTIIPVVNKIDLPAARPEAVRQEIISLLGCSPAEVIFASAKTGQGVKEILAAVVDHIPPPAASSGAFLRALIFDSNYDEYKGVVAYVRIVDGEVKAREKIALIATGASSEALAVGIFTPEYKNEPKLAGGQIGYIITGFKEVSECRVGDTITLAGAEKKIKPLKGYTEVKPIVFAGIFPREGSDFNDLREAVAKLKLNDAALVYEPEHSQALGFGLRCGFLGILHLEVFQERLRREYGLNLIVTVPSVAYKVYQTNGTVMTVRTPQQFPSREMIEKVEEPWVKLDIIAPKEYVGALMNLVQERRGVYKNTEYINTDIVSRERQGRVILHYEIPMSSILTDFYDKIKSVSAGYASINYEFSGYREARVIKMDILVAEEPVEALATIVYEDEAFRRGKEIVKILKETLPRQLFVVKLQATVGGRIVAAERISARRKDVTAKLYGGDVSRKRKLLEKQKKGKKRMLAAGRGRVEIPSDTFVKILRK